MSAVYAFRTIDVVLFVACSCTFFGEFHKSSAAVPQQYSQTYTQDDFSSDLLPPDHSHGLGRYHKKLSTKSSEVKDNSLYGSSGYVTSKVTTENMNSNEVSMDLPQSTFMHVIPFSTHSKFSQDDYYFFAKAAGVGLAVLVVLLISSIACYRMQKNSKAAADIEYPAYGITGPNKDMSPTGDRRLAQSAQMYHYQHQKQQIIAMETNSTVKESRCGSVSDPDSDDDNEEGDYTVYECPGLAPAGEMEVKNPLFQDDNTPASPNAVITKYPEFLIERDNSLLKPCLSFIAVVKLSNTNY